ncbi:hypothetical protein F511_39541 [Dorcoceras hygrometricum]|uniref:CCHC-type domain-containing protein n=1 Tax=Dorcoceras hygrometricum TaxID=472368 RepID=A0A2Z7BQH1_9LAMI|nr:hypothetical protein F511_39541 [Dorcoceras hygrometricum]
MVCDQQLNGLSSSADRFIKSDQQWYFSSWSIREDSAVGMLSVVDVSADEAYEFEVETRSEAPSTSQPTKALAAATAEPCSPSTSKSTDQLSDDVMSLFVKKFGKYLRRSFNPASTSFNNYNKSDKVSSDLKCYNCDRPGHFAADCNRPKKDDRYKRDDRRADDRYRKEERYKRDDEDNERNVEKSKDKLKERSSDIKMKTNSNKRFSRKHDRKVLVAEESSKSWADSDSDTSSSSSSSSDSEQEEVHCFMADQTDEDEVFDFSNVEFTRDDLVIALNGMVKDYRKLSHSFEEAKAENMSLKSSSAESSSDELEDTDILKTELSKLQAENEMLRNEISEIKAEVNKSTVEMSSWNKANFSLQKLYERQKQASDKTGIGFNNSEFCEGEPRTQSRSAYDKFNKMSFVKADMIYNCLESVKYDNQNSPKLNENGKAGIGFSKPERFKPNWLKNRLDKDKAKASQKPFVPNQSWHNSKKVKSGWKKFQQRRDQYDQHMKPKLKRPARDFAHTFVDPRSGKTNASIFQGLADVRHEVQAVNAKVDIMASRLNAIQKDAEATKEALSHQLLEFQSQAQENHNVIHAQLSSAVTPTFEQRVEMAQRRIVQTVLDADANRALLERQDAAERERERRRREARVLKRRRRD